MIREKGGTCKWVFPFFRFNLVRNMEEDNKLQTFTLQMQLPAPNLEVAKRVADEAQRLIDIYGYYNFLNLVEFMKQIPVWFKWD